MDFNEKSLNLIEESQMLITEIERAIFTKRYRLSSIHYTILSTNSISILYSTWEGYIQQICGLYIDEINNKKLDFFSLNERIIIYCKENKFKQFNEYPKKNQKKVKFYQNLQTFYSQSVHEIPRNFNTESNVGLEVLNKVMKTFNLETYPEHWGIYKHPNPNLRESLVSFLKVRNTVSHGGLLPTNETIDQNMYSRFKRLVLDLM